MEKAENNVSDHELDSAPSPEEEATAQSFSWSLRKVVILSSLCLLTVLSYGALSMIAPFFPHEAKVRGVSTTVVGLVFGTYPFMSFISAPFCGRLVAKYGPNRVLFSGIFTDGVSLILFGFCAWISSTTEFVVLSFLLRALSAFGGAATETATMAIVMGEFPKRLGMASGFIGTFVGVGVCIGPVAGGGLYTVGGFLLPLLFIGSSMIAAIPVLICVFPSDCGVNSGKMPDQEKVSFPIVETLKIPAVLMIAVCYVTTGLTEIYFQPILGPHLEKTLNLNTTQIGLVFLVGTVIYALTTPLSGWIGDKTQCYRWLTVSGFIGAGFGYFLLGPAPFLTFLPTKKVWFVCLCVAMAAFSWGVYYVQLMPDLVEITREQGMPDNFATRGVVSSIPSSMFNLGATIGPTLAGIIDQHFGFQWAMVVVGTIIFVQALVLAAFTLLEGTEAERRKIRYAQIQ